MNERIHGVLVAVVFALVTATALAQAGPSTPLPGPERTYSWLPVGADATAGGGKTLSVAVRQSSQTGLDVVVNLRGVSRTIVTGTDGQQYSQLAIPEAGVTADGIGQPALPFKGFFLEIPYGVNVSVRIRSANPVDLGSGHKIHPLQLPEPDDGSEPTPFQINAASYTQDRFIPAEPVLIGEPGIIRGRRVVFVKVFPVQYNPATGALRAYKSIEFRLEYEGQADPKGPRRKSRLASAASEAAARDLLLNYAPAKAPQAEGDADGALPESEAPAGGGDPEVAGTDGADYLIIVADALYDEILPLAEWKHRKGFITRILKMSEIGTTSADVKNAIQSAYDTWNPAPSYVLLVGDSEDVPSSYFYGQLECTTDQPYSCLEGDDYYPDVTLGRIPVRTTAQCATVVGKILTYERAPDTGNWYTAFLSAGYFQDTDDNNGIADRWFMETSVHATEFLEGTVGMTKYTAWCAGTGVPGPYHYRTTSYPHRFPYPDPIPESVTSLWQFIWDASDAITTAINSGVGLVFHRDHGSQTGWDDPPFDVGDVNNLANGVMTPVVLSLNCSTGSFQRGASDCFCEAFLKHPSGGAVAIVGATRVSYSGFNDLITHGLFTCHWPAYDPSHTDTTYPVSWRPAEALTYGKYYMLIYKDDGPYTEGEFNMFHYFGDPELMLRTESPEALTVTCPNSVGFSTSLNLVVSVQAGGAALEGARATISNVNTGEHWTGLSGADGNVAFDGIVFGAQDDYDLVVTSQNGIPYEATIVAGPSSVGTLDLDRQMYTCANTIAIHMTDADIAGSGSHDVTVTASNGDIETVILAESEPGIFDGGISTDAGPAAQQDGTLQLAHGALITATYQDDNNGSGTPVSVQKTAETDCEPPSISNVQVAEILSTHAFVTFETDTPATARIDCGMAAGGPFPFVGQSTELLTNHTVKIPNLTGETQYFFKVEVTDAAGNTAMDDNGGECYTFTTPFQLDYFTELFDANDNDLSYQSVTFVPNGSSNFYMACRDEVTEFHTDPNGGTVLTLGDNTSALVYLINGAQVQLFGIQAQAFFVGSNGYLTGPYSDNNPHESLASHFNSLRISAFFDDLNPSAGGTVSWKQLVDRAAITFENVPETGTTNSNSFQIEWFYDGRIRLTWLDIDATDGLVGLSPGQGVPSDFAESDVSQYGTCIPRCQLMLTVNNAALGRVELDPQPDYPNWPEYMQGTEITLTAVPENPEDVFVHWLIYDPNYPGDTNRAAEDTNTVLVLIMDTDREVTAIFKCGPGQVLPPVLPAGIVLASMVARRRRRFSR
ncbi:MAG: hypothetical protein JXQ73_01270 [Phycisphaerae bacterium]|nr:hypothetical protein [Phycisphaerae bacterium]